MYVDIAAGQHDSVRDVEKRREVLLGSVAESQAVHPPTPRPGGRLGYERLRSAGAHPWAISATFGGTDICRDEYDGWGRHRITSNAVSSS